MRYPVNYYVITDQYTSHFVIYTVLYADDILSMSASIEYVMTYGAISIHVEVNLTVYFLSISLMQFSSETSVGRTAPGLIYFHIIF